MTKPTVYTWLDDSAPVYSNTMSSFIALLRACLVDGYGTKAGAGWSIPFEDATSLILKQGGTNPLKHCLKIYDFEASTTRACAYYQIAQDYTDLNTPVDSWYDSSILDTYLKFPKGYSSSTAYQVPWIILATSRAVYFMFGYNNTVSGSIPDKFSSNNSFESGYNFNGFFGDYTPYHEWNTRNTMYALGSPSSTSPSYLTDFITQLGTSVSNKSFCGSLKDNRVAYSRAYYNTLVPESKGDNGYLGFNFTLPAPEGYNSKDNPVDNSLKLDVVRLTNEFALVGEMPGLLYHIHGRYFDKDKTDDISFKGVGGYEGKNIYIVNTYNGQAFIHDGEWGVE